MANTFGSISNEAALLKIFYAGPIVSQFNDEIPFYREIEKAKEKYNGLQVNRPIKVRRNPGIGATSDGGTLPKIGNQTTLQAVIAAKFLYLRFGITAGLLKASQGDKGAFVSAMEFEMEQGMTDLKNDVNRQLNWSGDGKIAEVSANAVGSTVITASGRTSTEAANKFLDVGMVIDVYTSAGVLEAQGVEITAISSSGLSSTITLSAAVTVTSGSLIVRGGSYNNEVQGTLTSQDGLTTSIFGINRALYPVFQGNSVNAGGGQLTLDKMQQAYNEAKRRGGMTIDYINCDYDSERFYNKLLVADKRYIGRVAGDGTFSSKDGSYLEFAGVPVVPDKDLYTVFQFISSKSWRKMVLSELEWADETGSYMIAQTSADSWEVRLRLFFNLFCDKPSANARHHNYISP
jgi:hypothetical protein